MLKHRYEKNQSMFNMDYANYWSNLSRLNNLLVIVGIYLYPPPVPLADRILLIIPDGPWGPDSPVCNTHHNGKPGTGRPVELLIHIKEAIGAGGSKGP